jgi:predicted DsbA family dithiol-disulfide isomerase
MENSREFEQTEAHLRRAEVELKVAEAEERAAEHAVEAAVRELREAEEIAHHEVLLEIATPKGLFEGVFRRTTEVSAVIVAVLRAKGLDSKDSFELVHGETVLQPADRTLGSFGLEGKVKLELVATGSGV